MRKLLCLALLAGLALCGLASTSEARVVRTRVVVKAPAAAVVVKQRAAVVKVQAGRTVVKVR